MGRNIKKRRMGEHADKSNRANRKDRPEKAVECRSGVLANCDNTFQFHRGDRYGWCKRCGCEVLT